MLEIKNLAKSFVVSNEEKVVLKDFNLQVDDGQFLVVIGSNGSGKSTLLNLIAGVHNCDEGKIILHNKEINSLKEHQRAMYLGRVFQDPSKGSFNEMSILENMELAMQRGNKKTLKWGFDKNHKKLFIEKLKMLNLGLENRLDSKVGLLSGGQRQALTLLMATLKKPDLLLLDEHTAALDPKTARIVLQLTEKIVQEEKLTAIMITHNLKDAIRYGNRLIMLNDGKIILDVQNEEKQNLTVEKLLHKFEIIENY